MVKSQIHAGGRGKGTFKDDPEGQRRRARRQIRRRSPRKRAEMLGNTLVTHQTGDAGKEVKRVYIEEGCDIARELYLAC